MFEFIDQSHMKSVEYLFWLKSTISGRIFNALMELRFDNLDHLPLSVSSRKSEVPSKEKWCLILICWLVPCNSRNFCNLAFLCCGGCEWNTSTDYPMCVLFFQFLFGLRFSLFSLTQFLLSSWISLSQNCYAICSMCIWSSIVQLIEK